jgi:membrane protease YdiL (CAAX protease family)
MDSVNPDSLPLVEAPARRPPQVWKFWGTALWGVLLVAAMLIGQIVPVALVVFFKARAIDLNMAADLVGDGRMLALSVFAGLPALLAALWLPIRLSRLSFADYLALRLPNWQNLVIGVVAMLAVVMGWDLLSRATGHEVTAGFMGDVLKSATADGALWMAIVAFAVAAPITEEFLARGFFYRGWSESFLRVPGAILLSSLVWTSLHLQYDLFFLGEVFSIGLVLGYVRYRSGSIWLTVLLHGLNNLAALIQTIWLNG